MQPSKQVAYIRGHPFAFVRAVGRMVTDYGSTIAHDVVAQTSYFRVSDVVAVLVAVGLLAVVVADRGTLPGGRRLQAVVLGLAALLVVVSLLLAYVGWNALRAPRLDGFQGRYLLLVLAMVCAVAYPARGRPVLALGSAGARRRRIEIAPLVVVWSAALLLAVECSLAWTVFH